MTVRAKELHREDAAPYGAPYGASYGLTDGVQIGRGNKPETAMFTITKDIKVKSYVQGQLASLIWVEGGIPRLC